jgi:hypothetical protein
MSSFTTLVKPVDTALISLHYAFPATIFGYFAISSAVALCTLSDIKEHARRRPLLALMLFTVLSYLAQIAAIIIPSIIIKEWLGQQDVMISLLSCILVFGLQFAILSDETEVAWYPFVGSYMLSLGLEPALMIVALSARAPGPLSGVEIAQVTIVASRYLAMGLVVATYFTWRKVDEPKDTTDAEQQPLIPKNSDGLPVQSSEEGEGSQSSTAYGSTSTTATSSSANSTTGNPDSDNSTEGNKDDSKDKDDKAKKSDEENTNELPWERRERKRREEMEKRLKENGNWFDYAKRFMVSLV